MNKKYSEKCDMFRIGAIFYYLISGKKLFPGTNLNEIINLNKLC